MDLPEDEVIAQRRAELEQERAALPFGDPSDEDWASVCATYPRLCKAAEEQLTAPWRASLLPS
jgi:hypothetical protein